MRDSISSSDIARYQRGRAAWRSQRSRAAAPARHIMKEVRHANWRLSINPCPRPPRSAPEVLEAVRGQFGVFHHVLLNAIYRMVHVITKQPISRTDNPDGQGLIDPVRLSAPA
jgi:hypothetical protein